MVMAGADDMAWRKSVLGKSLLFRTLSKRLTPEQCDAVAQAFVLKEYADRHYVIKQGTVGDTFYVITKGEMDITINLPDGAEKKVATRRAGDCVGEAGLLADKAEARMANCVANGKLSALELTKADFKRTVCGEGGGGEGGIRAGERLYNIRKWETQNEGNLVLTLKATELGDAVLRTYAKQTFCSEHLDFTDLVEKYKQATTADARCKCASEIFSRFVYTGSVESIYTTQEQREEVCTALEITDKDAVAGLSGGLATVSKSKDGAGAAANAPKKFACGTADPPLGVFDDLENASHTCMQFDVVPRFVDSKVYQNYLETVFPQVQTPRPKKRSSMCAVM